MEVWATGVSVPGVAARMAERAEAAGFDGMVIVDSQNLAGDCYVALAMAARATGSLLLGTGVTNPLTRHPAVTASAIASVHAESGGRAVLGIGRGDSALAHLGLAPAPVDRFERYLSQVQRYLAGEEVPFAESSADGDAEGTAPIDSLGLAAAPTSSRLHWLSPDLPKVPVDVAATGPKVIAAAARQADRLTLALGADPERVAWGIESARAARAADGQNPDDLPIGAFVNVVVTDDLEAGRRLVSGGMSTFARFNVMHGVTAGPADEADRAMLGRLHDAYDMRLHTRLDSPQAATLEPEFVDRFGIVGPASHCLERLGALVDLGIGRFVIVGPSLGASRDEAREASTRFVEEVLPGLRA